MDPSIFPNGGKLPSFIEEVADQSSFEGMTPGESTWVTPWTLEVNEDGVAAVSPSSIERGQTPGGTVKLKLIKDFDGLYVDATALSYEDIQRYLNPKRGRSVVGDDGIRQAVNGILYPTMPTVEGINPTAVNQFNKEQAKVKKHFSDYFKQTYGQEYTFAEAEARRPAYYSAPDIGQVATGGKRRSRWGK